MKSKGNIKLLKIAAILIPPMVSLACIQNELALANNSGVLSSPSEQLSRSLTRKTGIGTDSFPVGIAINELTNMIYVANEMSNTVSVINGINDNIESTVFVGVTPYGVAVDPLTNRIYVTNIGSDSISVIDGSTNAVTATIEDVTSPVSLNVDSLNSWIYVTNIDTNTLSKINAITNRIEQNITVGKYPYSVDTDLGREYKIYVTNFGSNTVSVIDGDSFKLLKNIDVGESPVGVVANPVTNTVYVTNRGSGSVSVIDAISDVIIKNITVGGHPDGIAINSKTNVIYVMDTGSVLVIDGETNQLTKNLTLNSNLIAGNLTDPAAPAIRFPNVASFVGVNERTNVIYGTNTASNTVSVIDGRTGKIAVGIIFKTNPTNSGNIYCNGQPVRTSYVRYDIGTELVCEAKANDGFVFSSWSKGNISTSAFNPLAFTVNENGNITASFGQLLTLDKYQAIVVAYLAILAPISTIISLITLMVRRRQKRIFNKKLQEIEDLELSQDIHLQTLVEQKRDIRNAFVTEKITESQYSILESRISKLIEDHKRVTRS
jgi:YVTN family beta-propeller protein